MTSDTSPGEDKVTPDSTKSFTGFDAEDLTAFRRHAWTNDEFTLARKTTIRKLELLVGKAWKKIRAKDESLGLKLVVSAGGPGPENDGKVEAAWVALIRNAQAQKAAIRKSTGKHKLHLSPRDKAPFYTCPSIVARLDADGLFFGFGLPRIANPDTEMFLRKWKSKAWRASFLKTLQGLPDGCIFGDDQGMTIDVQSLTTGSLSIAIDAFSRGIGWLMIGRRYSEEQSLHEPSLLELEISEHAQSLAEIYRLIAFCPKVQPRSRAQGHGKKPQSSRKSKANGRPGKAPREEPIRKLDRPARADDIVRIHNGMFAGKVGRVVADRVDAVEVRLGRLPVWIPKTDVWVLAPKE